jgi:type II secretory pathway pseudopilin PulG
MAGFTIVETMIVLAVTGLLFATIATTWFGRQHETEFQTSAQDVRSRIQQVISDVQNGYFPNQDNFTCKVNASGLLLDGGSSQQGTNQQCVFLGKIIQFHLKDTDPEVYRVYTVAADSSQTDIRAAKPKVVAPSTTPPPATGNGLTDNSQGGTLQSGLSLQAYRIGLSGVVKLSQTSKDIAVGFLSSLGSLDSNNVYNNGTQQVNFYPLSENTWPTTSRDAANAINSQLLTDLTPTMNVATKLCFQSGSTNQFAVITIGGSSSTLTAVLTVRDGTCDVDFS